jgi:hypothetical protein
MFLSDMMLAVAFVIGLLLMWIGALIWGTANDRNVEDLGMIVKSLGVLALTGAMLLGGLVRHDMDKVVRGVLVIGAVLLLIFVGFWGPY